MSGGLGTDTFIFGAASGSDVVTDFSVSEADNIIFGSKLWGTALLTEAEVVAQFAQVIAGNVVFDFGGSAGHELLGQERRGLLSCKKDSGPQAGPLSRRDQR